MVHTGAAQAADQTVTVNLNDIQTCLLGANGARAHLVNDLQQHFLADFVGEEHHIMVQTLPHFIHFALHKQSIDSIHVIFRVENLSAQLGTVGVDAVSKRLKGGNLAIVKQFRGGGKAVDGSNVAQNNVADTTLGKAGIEAHILLRNHTVFFVTGGQRREHNTVFKGLTAHLYGLQKNVFHE